MNCRYSIPHCKPFFIVLSESMLVYFRDWWVPMACPWSMGQQESKERNTGQKKQQCLFPKLGLHPLQPRHRYSPRSSPRDRSATSTPIPYLSAGLPPPRIKTQWVRCYPNTTKLSKEENGQNVWTSSFIEEHKTYHCKYFSNNGETLRSNLNMELKRKGEVCFKMLIIWSYARFQLSTELYNKSC